MTKKRQLRFTIIRSLVAILIALLVATILIFISATGNTLQERLSATQEALKQMLLGPLFRFSRKKGTAFELKRVADILAAMIPTIFTGLSVCVMFSANQFNLGAEGGIMLGAFISAMAAIYIPLPPGMHAVVAVLLGGLAVAVVMLLPALLKSKLNVSEMVCSLMLNYIIMYVIKFLMNTYLADKTRGQIMSYAFRETSNIPPIINNTVFSGAKLTWGFVIAIAAVIATALRIFFLNDCFMISPVFFQSAVLTLPPALPPEVLASGNGIPVFRDGRNELDSLFAAGDIVRKEQHALGLDAAKLSRLQVRHDDDLLANAVFRLEVLGHT